jgi:hypothetical protein
MSKVPEFNMPPRHSFTALRWILINTGLQNKTKQNKKKTTLEFFRPCEADMSSETTQAI